MPGNAAGVTVRGLMLLKAGQDALRSRVTPPPRADWWTRFKGERPMAWLRGGN